MRSILVLINLVFTIMNSLILMKKLTFTLVVIAICITALISCEKTKSDKLTYKASFSKESTSIAENQETTYIFSVHPLHNPQRLFKIFNPLMVYLSDNIQGAKFRLEASKNYASYDKKLALKHSDFSLPNPYQTILAIDDGYNVFAKMADDENFRGIIIVRKDSNINKVTDLIGKSVSYPAPTALAATMMPQFFLQKNGVNVLKDIDNRYVGSQESSIMNVYVGNTSAASTWPPPWLALIKERPELAEELTIKWETPHLINNSLIAREDIDPNLVKQVKDLLVNLHKTKIGREIIEQMELSAFEAANNETYNIVREFVVDFNKEVIQK